MIKKITFIGLLIVLFAMLTTLSFAQQSALNDILERGVIKIGAQTVAPPWGYLDANYEFAGFDIDIAKELAKELGVEIEFIETASMNRVPNIVTGKVDIMIGVFGITLDRAKSIEYSKPYAPYFLVVAGPKDVKADTIESLKEIKVALPRGSTVELKLSEIVPEGTELLRYEEPSDAFLAVEQGKADVFADGYDLAAYQVKLHPDWEIKLEGKPFARTFPAMGIKQGDQVWLNWVNQFITLKLSDGTIQKLYEKHFEIPWPEAGGVWPSF